MLLEGNMAWVPENRRNRELIGQEAKRRGQRSMGLWFSCTKAEQIAEKVGATPSAEELNLTVIDVQAQRLKPPPYLKKEEKAIWEHLVGHSHPRHFKESDAPLLSLYCTSIHLAKFYAAAIGDEGDDGRNHKNWTENARLAASLATRLRLSPSSRYDARQADRYSDALPADGPRPWDRRAHHEAD
jgi:phage terminase small subunit